MSIFLLVIISLLTTISAFLSSISTFADKRRVWYKMIKPTGWWVISINMVVIILSCIQFYVNKLESDKKDIINDSLQKQRDSIIRAEYRRSVEDMQVRFDTSKNQTFTILGTALGKYGYMFDSTKLLLKKVQESPNTLVYTGVDPVVDFCYNHNILKDTTTLSNCSIKICNSDAPSSDWDLTLYVIYVGENGKIIHQNREKIIVTNSISIGAEHTNSFNLPFINYSKQIFFVINGKYKNADKTKTHILTSYRKYFVETKESSIMSSEDDLITKAELKNYIESFYKISFVK